MSKSATLAAFLHKFLGQANVGNNPENRGQCVGLIEDWLTACGKPDIWGNAVDILKDATSPPFTVVHNDPQNYPQPGDVVCWDSTWGSGYGHTAVVVAATNMRLAVFEQNDPEGAPCVIATHDYAGVMGWLTWPE